MTNSLLKKGMALHQAGQISEADKTYSQLLAAEPGNPEALHLLGLLRFQSGQHSAGTKLIEQAVSKRPQFSEALFNLGVVYYAQGMAQQAILAYTRAVRSKSDYVKAWYGLGTSFSETGMHDQAIATFAEALLLNPKATDLYEGQCRAYKRQGDYEKCIESASKGLEVNAQDVRLRIHRSEAYFAVGRLQQAWTDYVWRTNHPDNVNRPYAYSYAKWAGENLTGKTILVQTEQGPGETFLFSSMINDVLSQADKTVIVTSDRLKPILARSFPNASVFVEGTEPASLPTIDYQCALPDLGRWLRPTWDSFQHTTPTIIADPERAAAFQKIYGRRRRDKLVVGISWCSLGVTTAPWKSIPLEAWKPILSTPGIEFVSLQYGDTRQEISHLESTTSLSLSTDPSVDPVADLEGHLAQIAAMDLVITTSNTTAHAAASQGIETWVLLPARIGSGLRWTWFCERKDSPWYNSARLFRQTIDGDWSTPIADTAIALVNRRTEDAAPFDSQAHLVSMALAYRGVGLARAMGQAARAALEVKPSSAVAALLLAESLRLDDRKHEALEVVETALSSDTSENRPDLLCERAQCLIKTGEPSSAVHDLEAAEALKPQNADILYRLSNAHRLSGHPTEAVRYIERAAALAPNNRTLLTAQGTLLFENGDIDDSVATFDKVLAANPDDHDAAASRAIALLTGERYAEGWQAYKSRLKNPNANARYDKFPQPAWNGEPLQKASVLVWTEQGVGEEILISTLIPELANQARKVTLLCSSRLVSLFKRSFPNVVVEERTEPLAQAACDPAIDFQMSWSDLGQALRSTPESFQDEKHGPALVADPNLIEQFRSQYKQSGNTRPCIGLTWRSTSPDLGPVKSIDLDLMADIIGRCDATFVSLQHAPELTDTDKLASAGAEKWILDSSVDPLSDMDRAAAQVAAMDYVISVSNSTVHLAGGLGVPTALLVPPETGRHWYWTRGHKTSLWYDSVELYETLGHPRWRDSVENVIRDLERLGKSQ